MWIVTRESVFVIVSPSGMVRHRVRLEESPARHYNFC
jgi:hypothetical protein